MLMDLERKNPQLANQINSMMAKKVNPKNILEQVMPKELTNDQISTLKSMGFNEEMIYNLYKKI